MEYSIYWLINKNGDKTYIGFSDNIDRRLSEHRSKKVKTTKSFGNFSWRIIENIKDEKQARIREKYWKSCTGRKKLKELFKNSLNS